MNSPKLLKVVPLEEDMLYPRYVIEDKDQTVWDGKVFIAERKKGILYASTEDACAAIQEILKSDLRQKVLIRLVAPVEIEVYADPDAIVNPLDIASWLSRTCRLQMNTSENGVGPSNMVVLPVINWHQINGSLS